MYRALIFFLVLLAGCKVDEKVQCRKQGGQMTQRCRTVQRCVEEWGTTECEHVEKCDMVCKFPTEKE